MLSDPCINSQVCTCDRKDVNVALEMVVVLVLVLVRRCYHPECLVDSLYILPSHPFSRIDVFCCWFVRCPNKKFPEIILSEIHPSGNTDLNYHPLPLDIPAQ